MRAKEISAVIGFFVTVAASTSRADGALQPFLENYCLQCHGAEKQKGDRRFDLLGADLKNHADAAVSINVVPKYARERKERSQRCEPAAKTTPHAAPSNRRRRPPPAITRKWHKLPVSVTSTKT